MIGELTPEKTYGCPYIKKNFIDFRCHKLSQKKILRKKMSSHFLTLYRQQERMLIVFIIAFIVLRVTNCHSLLLAGPRYIGFSDDLSYVSSLNISNNSYKNTVSRVDHADDQSSSRKNILRQDASTSDIYSHAKAYGKTSTTKRSISDNMNVSSLTTIATPLLTTLRYIEKKPNNEKVIHHRNYELDLERDHALPTSAPNADILKSNSNPTYPNPNRYQAFHDRGTQRYTLSSISAPSPFSFMSKNNNSTSVGGSVLPSSILSYSPPARVLFTPPLPPEYQNPFADKPTLRGTDHKANYINRRPIPPPSLVPGHDRIPLRPPELASSKGTIEAQLNNSVAIPAVSAHGQTGVSSIDWEHKNVLNTPSQARSGSTAVSYPETSTDGGLISNKSAEGQLMGNTHQRDEVLPSIRRMLSGSNGSKEKIPQVLLKQVTSTSVFHNHQPPSPPIILVESTSPGNSENVLVTISNINRSKSQSNVNDFGISQYEEEKDAAKFKISTKSILMQNNTNEITLNITARAPVIEGTAAIPTYTTIAKNSTKMISTTKSSSNATSLSTLSTSGAASGAVTTAHAIWTIAWNIHVYLSVILFTILGVYSLYKVITYNKLTHLFTQSYFICIHIILVIICSLRVFYLCYDAYNIHSSFHMFVSELLLNLPAIFLTISFSVLILFLFVKSLNQKNCRYSALLRPLTVIVACGVHVLLCITLHYVEAYTTQQYVYHQQQFYRQQLQQPKQKHDNISISNIPSSSSSPPPRVLSLICQIIYIFICVSLGLLYLYIYRVLKRILYNKSQNYIHSYQHLSYAVHITIATALLYLLSAALQIFGAISISLTRPLAMQNSVESDWLQWGYQFSLRLIEMAIITLTSWVSGLKTSSDMSTIVIERRVKNIGGPHGVTRVFGITYSGGVSREKHTQYPKDHRQQNHNRAHHSNVAGFFFPCTSASSQENFEIDYPAICNANTKLHTYTMRTGKLIYDDSFPLNSLPSSGGDVMMEAGVAVNSEGAIRSADFHTQSTYQRTYDTGSVDSAAGSQVDMGNCLGGGSIAYPVCSQHSYRDNLINAVSDHYEDPNSKLHSYKSSTAENKIHDVIATCIAPTSTTSTTTSRSGDLASETSLVLQQQMMVMKTETACYSEPIQQNFKGSPNYAFNKYERPKFVRDVNGAVSVACVGYHQSMGYEVWPEHSQDARYLCDKKCRRHFECVLHENPECGGSKLMRSCSSNTGLFEGSACSEGGGSNTTGSGNVYDHFSNFS